MCGPSTAKPSKASNIDERLADLKKYWHRRPTKNSVLPNSRCESSSNPLKKSSASDVPKIVFDSPPTKKNLTTNSPPASTQKTSMVNLMETKLLKLLVQHVEWVLRDVPKALEVVNLSAKPRDFRKVCGDGYPVGLMGGFGEMERLCDLFFRVFLNILILRCFSKRQF